MYITYIIIGIILDSSINFLISSQKGNLDALDTVANNMANSNTTGFRKQGMLFSEFINEDNGSFSNNIANFDVHNQGSLQHTGSVFDVALTSKDVFFAVDSPIGKAYTRNGSFSINDNFNLVNIDGLPVLNASGGPIVLGNYKNIKILSDGTIVADGAIIGKIGVFLFKNLKSLARNKNSLFYSKEEPTIYTESAVSQGFLESSNVNSITETSDMININRNFSNNSSLQSEINKMRIDLIQNIAD